MGSRETLENGLTLCLETENHLHIAEVALFLRCGALYEDLQTQGLSHLLEHLHYRRMGNLDHEELNRLQGVMGTELEGATYPEGIVYRLLVMPDQLMQGARVMAELLKDTVWEREETRREKMVVIRQIEAEEKDFDNDMEILSRETEAGAYPLMGCASRIRRATPEVLQSWRRKTFTPDNAVLCLSGCLKEADIRKVRHLFGTLPVSGERIHAPYPLKDWNRRGRGNDVIRGGDGELCRVFLTLDVPREVRRERVNLLSAMTGGNVDSRLFLRLREEKGWVAEVESYVEEIGRERLFCIRYDVSPVFFQDTLFSAMDILQGIGQEVQEADLLSGKRQIRLHTAALRDDPVSLNDMMGWGCLQGEEDVFESLRMDALTEAIAPEEIRNLARELFTGRNLRICVECPSESLPHFRKMAGQARKMLS